MKMKLSFAQRLVRQSSLSNEKKVGPKISSVDKKYDLKIKDPKASYINFRQQHNQLQSMLKLFDFKNSHPQYQTPQLLSPISPISPVKNRLLQKKPYNKPKIINLRDIETESIKPKAKIQKIIKPNYQEFKSHKSQIIVASSPLIPIQRQDKTAKNNLTVKKGIPNIGNTCYINALVQCLFHLPHFNDFFINQKYIGQRNGRPKDIVQIYRNLYLNVISCNKKVDLSTVPLKRSVSKLCHLFMDMQQEDAHEFMKELLNIIHQNLNRVKVKPKYTQFSLDFQNASIETMASSYWLHAKEVDDSYIYDSFCGQLYNNIKCVSCKKQKQCFQNFLDLSLPMVQKAKSLSNLLKKFFEPQSLSDYYRCEFCHQYCKKSTKSIQLWKLPKFLIIHLKRSQFGKKNNDPISISESLTLKQFMNLSNDKTAKFCQYSLCGIIMHRGQLQAGHYWCNVKSHGKWYSIDDQKVEQLDNQKFRRQNIINGNGNVYILFYSSFYI